MVAKLLRPDQVEDAGALRELRCEADALAALAHPVLVRGFDAVVDGPHPHLLIELLEGPTLRELIEQGDTLALEQLLPLAMHTAAALHYMAGEGWVHLDVKPANIVMGAPPRLIDLSVARTVARARRLRRAIGTDAYMAPEQCLPRPRRSRSGRRPTCSGSARRSTTCSRARRPSRASAARGTRAIPRCAGRSSSPRPRRCRGGCRSGSPRSWGAASRATRPSGRPRRRSPRSSSRWWPRCRGRWALTRR